MIRIVNTNTKKAKRIGEKIMSKKYIVVSVTISIIISVLMCISVFNKKTDLENIVDTSVDKNFNIYELNYNTQTEKFRLIKADKHGHIKAYEDFDSVGENKEINYDQIEVDGYGNIFVKVTEINNTVEKNLRPILKEKVLMYDNNLNFIREIVSVDFSNRSDTVEKTYIFNYQVMNNKIKIFCRDGNNYEILSANIDEDQPLEIEHKFTIIPDISSMENVKWVSDIMVSSTGKIVYSDYVGRLYISDGDGFKHINDIVSDNKIFSSAFSLDSDDNLYFTDIINMDYYQLNLGNLNINKLYNKDSIINAKKNIRFADSTYVNYVEDGEFYGMLRTSDNTQYISFGKTETYIDRLVGNDIHFKILFILISSAILFLIILGIIKVILKLKSRAFLTLKIMLRFLPAYMISMGALFVILIYMLIERNSSILLVGQATNAKIAEENINGDLFKKINSNESYLSDEFDNVRKQIDRAYKRAYEYSTPKLDYIMSYVENNGVLFRNFMIGDSQDFFASDEQVNFLNRASSIVPIDYSLDEDTVSRYYSLWDVIKSGKTPSTSDLSFIVNDNHGEWLVSCEPIYDSEGQAVGFIGSSINKWESQDVFFYKTVGFVTIAFSVTVIITFVYFIVVLKFAFLPLKELDKGVKKIGEGKWDTKVNIKSRDEFAEIGNGFNMMTDRINRYVSSYAELNQIYFKFVPSGLIKLLGKTDILGINLDDRNHELVSVLTIKFDVKKENYLTIENMNDYFQRTNQKYMMLFDTVRENNGIIEKFDAFGMTVLFLGNPFHAVTASIQFVEQLSLDDFKNSFRIALGVADATIGVMGDNSRISISIISEEHLLMDYVCDFLDKVKVKHFALQSMIDAIEDDSISDIYRFIGQVKHPLRNKPVKIYEFIDNNILNKKKLYIELKPLFEQGVNNYINGDFFKARRIFSEVLSLNESDSMAMYYLGLCDNLNYQMIKDWKGYLF